MNPSVLDPFRIGLGDMRENNEGSVCGIIESSLKPRRRRDGTVRKGKM